MSTYNAKNKEYNYEYRAKNLKRVGIDFTKEYYSNVLKPAAEATGEPVNTFIKKAIRMRLGEQEPGDELERVPVDEGC